MVVEGLDTGKRCKLWEARFGRGERAKGASDERWEEGGEGDESGGEELHGEWRLDLLEV